jgi:hypothetical protein
VSLSVPRFRLALLAALAVLAFAASPASASRDRDYGVTTLALDPAAVSALTGLGVTPAPIAPARATRGGELAFPITNPFRNALRTGVIRHSGGISLTAGSTSVKLEDFVIEPLRGQLTARVGTARVPILTLDLSRARPSLKHGSLRLGPVGGSLTDVAAGALNGAFGLAPGTVPAGLKLGDATVRYRLLGW